MNRASAGTGNETDAAVACVSGARGQGVSGGGMPRPRMCANGSGDSNSLLSGELKSESAGAASMSVSA